MISGRIQNWPKLWPLRRLLCSQCKPPPTEEKDDEATLLERYKKSQFPACVEQKINEQIGFELHASHVSFGLAQYFYNTDLFLPGFGKFFRRLSETERQHAMLLCEFQNQRGGRVQLGEIGEPSKHDFQTLCDPFTSMLEIEHGLCEHLHGLIDCAFKEKDFSSSCFIAVKLVQDQMEMIRALNVMITRIKLATSSQGVLHLDDQLSQLCVPEKIDFKQINPNLK